MPTLSGQVTSHSHAYVLSRSFILAYQGVCLQLFQYEWTFEFPRMDIWIPHGRMFEFPWTDVWISTDGCLNFHGRMFEFQRVDVWISTDGRLNFHGRMFEFPRTDVWISTVDVWISTDGRLNFHGWMFEFPRIDVWISTDWCLNFHGWMFEFPRMTVWISICPAGSRKLGPHHPLHPCCLLKLRKLILIRIVTEAANNFFSSYQTCISIYALKEHFN
jgi:hypothetical protein